MSQCLDFLYLSSEGFNLLLVSPVSSSFSLTLVFLKHLAIFPEGDVHEHSSGGYGGGMMGWNVTVKFSIVNSTLSADSI